jgi:hypothetical protein
MWQACSLCYVVPMAQSMAVNPLQALITTRLSELELSQRAASLRASSLLNSNTIGRILRGETLRITDQTVAGLALALDVPQDTVRAAAEDAANPQRYIDYTENFAKLSPDAQSKVFAVLEEVLAEHEEAERRRKAASPRSKFRRK